MAKAPIPHYFLYGDTSPVDELEFIHVESITYRSISFDGEINPHRHDNLFQLVFFEEGRFTAMVDTEEKHSYGPAIVTIPSTVVHGFSVHPNTRGQVFTIANSFLNSLFLEQEWENLKFIFTKPSINQIDPSTLSSRNISFFIQQLITEYRQHNNGRETMIGAYLKVLLIEIYRLAAFSQMGRLGNTQQTKTFNAFQEILEHHFKEHRTVKEYAEQLNITENRLNRICREATDQSVSQIIHNRILLEAKRCLVYTGVGITELAYDLGYKEPAYFSRFFTKHLGINPSEFRAKLKK